MSCVEYEKFLSGFTNTQMQGVSATCPGQELPSPAGQSRGPLRGHRDGGEEGERSVPAGLQTRASNKGYGGTSALLSTGAQENEARDELMLVERWGAVTRLPRSQSPGRETYQGSASMQHTGSGQNRRQSHIFG